MYNTILDHLQVLPLFNKGDGGGGGGSKKQKAPSPHPGTSFSL